MSLNIHSFTITGNAADLQPHTHTHLQPLAIQCNLRDSQDGGNRITLVLVLYGSAVFTSHNRDVAYCL